MYNLFGYLQGDGFVKGISYETSEKKQKRIELCVQISFHRLASRQLFHLSGTKKKNKERKMRVFIVLLP